MFTAPEVFDQDEDSMVVVLQESPPLELHEKTSGGGSGLSRSRDMDRRLTALAEASVARHMTIEFE